MIGILFVIFIIATLIGLPIAFGLSGLAVLIMLIEGIFNPVILSQNMYSGMDSFPLLAIPFFMLAGTIMEESQITKRLMDFAFSLVGRLTGGLAHVAILMAMIFAAMSGSAVASAAAIGAIMLPSMRDRGYNKGFSAALIASGGAIGPIIPPSIPMIVYAVIAGVSVEKMFLGGAVPGIAFGLLLMIYSYFYAKKNKYEREDSKFTVENFLKSFKDAILPLLTPVIILGGIFSGVFTATEASVVAVIYSLFIGLFVFKTIKLKALPRVLLEAVKSTSGIMIIIASASALSWVLTSQLIPQKIVTALMAISNNSTIVLLLIMGFVLILGCFLDALSIITLVSPVVLPVIRLLGIDPVLFGVLITINICIGSLTPPVGTCLFVASKIGKTSLGETSKEALPMVGLAVGLLLACVIFPDIVMFLPNLLIK